MTIFIYIYLLLNICKKNLNRILYILFYFYNGFRKDIGGYDYKIYKGATRFIMKSYNILY
jgi:hypothetical protein